MNGRQLSREELRQRASAALRHGVFSAGLVSALTKKQFDRRRWRYSSALRKATGDGASTSKELDALRDAARFDVLIALADVELDERSHPLVADPRTGATWPLVERRDGWLAQRAKALASLRDVGAHAEPADLSAYAPRVRTAGRPRGGAA